MKKLMFVCTGNVCRSPMAHYYAQYKVRKQGKEEEYLIDSCGTYAQTGESATKNAIDAMKEYNVDLTSHRAKNIEDTDIENYDLVICLTNSHKINVLTLYPKLNNKVFTLKEYVDKDTKYIDIDDPWGLNLNTYKACAKEITKMVDKLLEKF